MEKFILTNFSIKRKEHPSQRNIIDPIYGSFPRIKGEVLNVEMSFDSYGDTSLISDDQILRQIAEKLDKICNNLNT